MEPTTADLYLALVLGTVGVCAASVAVIAAIAWPINKFLDRRAARRQAKCGL